MCKTRASDTKTTQEDTKARKWKTRGKKEPNSFSLQQPLVFSKIVSAMT